MVGVAPIGTSTGHCGLPHLFIRGNSQNHARAAECPALDSVKGTR
ncbi:predicted protein [Plenodomus lingam JN3]|uniref:Predicted protein n=1 Tax=Leptosphaeria maculans (strain JN3 / isolate v23.1.3 / race Av1-4-5-6-7-8) TaxID=985895 RepID=E5A1S3_LEPMJ|nr:predicted protein [Plenodomus lingam JN3]CBX97640.1 predicted protein [Plenodomus lingam JN3]